MEEGGECNRFLENSQNCCKTCSTEIKRSQDLGTEVEPFLHIELITRSTIVRKRWVLKFSCLYLFLFHCTFHHLSPSPEHQYFMQELLHRSLILTASPGFPVALLSVSVQYIQYMEMPFTWYINKVFEFITNQHTFNWI